MGDSIHAMINMSYAELIVISTSINTFMTRDSTQFAGYGVDSADITAYLAKITVFENLPTDTEVAAVSIEATATKNQIATELRTMLRGFSERARLAFGSTDAKYTLFHSGDLSKMADSELLVFGRMVKRSADLYAAELLPFGLTALMITALETLVDNFEVALNDQRTAVAERDIATNNRVTKALELYNMLISYCETGKVIWYGVNEAYYNDYVIFGPSGQLLTLVYPFDFQYNNVLQKFLWSGISNATSYEIEFSLNHVDWQVLWTGTATEYSIIPPGDISTEFRCRARNSAGYGPYCDPITILYVQPLSPPSSLAVTSDNSAPPAVYLDLSWAGVEGATFYKVYECCVNFGQPEGVYTDIGDFTLTSMRKQAIKNRRYYYKVAACTTGTQSGDSEMVLVDVPL